MQDLRYASVMIRLVVLLLAGTGSAASVGRVSLPELKDETAITKTDWDNMRQISQVFRSKGKVRRLSEANWRKYGGVGKAPARWRDISDAQARLANTGGWAVLVQFAAVYAAESDPKIKDKVRSLFLVAAAANMKRNNSREGSTYNVSKLGILKAILAMKEPLQEAGTYDALVQSWMMEERFMLKDHPYENLDWVRARIPMSWALVANMRDGPLKLYRLQLLQRATSLVLEKVITPDGGAIHHNCDHISYAGYSIMPIAELALSLHPTAFRLSHKAIKHLRAFARSHALASVDLFMPGNLGARASLPGIELRFLPSLLLTLDKIDELEGSDLREMRSLFLALRGRHDSWGQKRKWLSELGLPSIRGHVSYNVSAAAIHRRDDWLVVVDGCREPFKGIEMYVDPGAPRSFMRNSAFGSLQILRRGLHAAEQGYVYKGWDHNHYAGVTAAVLPLEALVTTRHTEQIRNKSTFGGGTSLADNGIWGMICKTGTGKAYRKSAFFFDNRVTSLTSAGGPADAQSRIPDRAPSKPIHTTLFQFSLTDKTKATVLREEQVIAFPYREVVPLEKALRLRDHHGNGYYVHPTQDATLEVRRSTQRSGQVDNPRKGLGAGEFEMAFIDHRGSPQAAFSLYVGAPADEVPQYQILRQDRIAHALYDERSSTIGCVVFEPDTELSVGPIRRLNRPGVIMVAKEDPKMLHCSISATIREWDQVYQGKAVPTMTLPETRIQVAGSWQLRESNRENIRLARDGNSTWIHIPYRDYQPVEITLLQQDSP